MLSTKRLLQINLFVAVLISSTLLGIALESSSMIAVGVIGASLGFIFTDLIRLFHLRGLIANIASLLILYLAMKDFFALDGTGKLISVANLLVYLQTVLMFQEKTPRLNWQVMILSLLQVVVSGIFSLNLEGGLLFLTYFLVIGSAMFLQSSYSQQFQIETLNRSASGRVRQALGLERSNQDSWVAESSSSVNRVEGVTLAGPPVTFFDYKAQTPLRLTTIGLQLFLWAGAAFVFTLTLFYLAPRHARPWYGPMSTQVTTAGVSKSVDLDERGVIELSTQLMFRAKFSAWDGKPLRLSGTPYFRGLALSDLVIRNGKTDWRAPQDRVAEEHYQEIPSTLDTDPGTGRIVMQSYRMEETEDPLLYGVFPFFRSRDTPKTTQFCHEISGLTRCRLRDTIDRAPYKFEAATIIGPKGSFAKSWPYIANTGPYVQRPMAEDQPQIKWLTKMDPDRYPTLCALSDQIAKENRESNGSRLDLLRKMERYLQAGGSFRYTLDYRNIKRIESLDPVEDFVRNHRTGHCELYASALTLMLRRQGVPARLVVGFLGGSYNEETNTYMVRANNAHAWVEAYLAPSDCTSEMLDSRQAGDGGAWMILEGTPLSGGEDSDESEALDVARNVWDDYVLGRDDDPATEGGTTPVFTWLRYLDVEAIESRMNQLKNTASQPWIKFGIPGALFAVIVFLMIRKSLNDSEQSAKLGEKKVGLFRRMVASAISIISPKLSQWVMGRSNRRKIDFYDRLVKLLAQYRLVRSPSQTHREFATEVVGKFSDHPKSDLIKDQVFMLTDYFNRVRFGNEDVDAEQEKEIATSLKKLEQAMTPLKET